MVRIKLDGRDLRARARCGRGAPALPQILRICPRHARHPQGAQAVGHSQLRQSVLSDRSKSHSSHFRPRVTSGGRPLVLQKPAFHNLLLCEIRRPRRDTIPNGRNLAVTDVRSALGNATTPIGRNATTLIASWPRLSQSSTSCRIESSAA